MKQKKMCYFYCHTSNCQVTATVPKCLVKWKRHYHRYVCIGGKNSVYIGFGTICWFQASTQSLGPCPLWVSEDYCMSLFLQCRGNETYRKKKGLYKSGLKFRILFLSYTVTRFGFFQSFYSWVNLLSIILSCTPSLFSIRRAKNTFSSSNNFTSVLRIGGGGMNAYQTSKEAQTQKVLRVGCRPSK